MANRTGAGSAPLFGASTPAQIRAIQARLLKKADGHAADPERARAIMREVGALGVED